MNESPENYTERKSQSQKCDSIYITYLKQQNFRDGEHISVFQVLRTGLEGKKCKGGECGYKRTIQIYTYDKIV